MILLLEVLILFRFVLKGGIKIERSEESHVPNRYLNHQLPLFGKHVKPYCFISGLTNRLSKFEMVGDDLN